MAEDPTDLGGVEPRKKPSWLIVGVIAVVVIAATMFFTGGNEDKPANSGTNPSTPVVTIPQLKNSIDSLTTTVSGFSGRLANLETQVAGLTAPSVTQADIDSLQIYITAMSVELATLSVKVAELDGNGTGENSNGTAYIGEISRWDFDSLTILGCTADYTFEVVSKSPSRVEEEDLYEITVEITNTDTTIYNATNTTAWDAATIALNHELEIILSPRDYCMVDDAITYLDSDGYPYLSWDADFVTRTREGQEVCRRITFTSETYNFGSLSPGGSLELDLVFELYYA